MILKKLNKYWVWTLCGLFLLNLSPVESAEQSAPSQIEVWTGGKILTATGQNFDPGTMVVDGGKVSAIGATDQVEIPEGATIHDMSGKVLIPGLVDTHSHLGVYSRPGVPSNKDGNEATGPVQGIVRALDALNPFDPGIKMALSGGVTTANVMPGSANVIGGQTIYIKLRGYTPERMWIDTEKTLGGLKMANGENPKRSYGSRGQAPGTRMKIAALQRATFLKARHYQEEWEYYHKQQAQGEEAEPPARDLELEPLVEVLEKKRTVHFHTHRADDILTVLRLKREFDFELVIQHGTEAFKVADEIAAAQVPVSMTVVDSPGGKQEVVDFLEQTGAMLTQAGVKVIINTDDPVTESRFLLRTAAVTVRGGLSEEDALKGLTLYPAQAMHLEDRIGSLEVGKDADFVVLSGNPFSVYTRVLETRIEGKSCFSLEDSEQRWYQTGAFALLNKELRPEFPSPPQAMELPEITLAEPAKKWEPGATEYIVRAERLFTGTSEFLDDGAVWIRDGKIVSVGTFAELNAPGELPVLTAKVVSPGLIDAYSQVPLAGIYNVSADQEQNEPSGTIQPELRALDAFNPHEPLLRYLLQQGVTLIHACPGRNNLIAGQSGLFHTYGQNADEMVIRFPQSLVLNLGDSPKEAADGKAPGTRMGVASILRKTFQEAKNKIKAEEDEAVEATKTEIDRSQPALAERPAPIPKPEQRDLKQEILAQALNQELPVLICAQRADDLQTGLRLLSEFQMQGILTLAGEAYLIRDQLAEAKLPLIVHPTMQRVGDLETYHSFTGNAATLAKTGALVAICSGYESYVPKTRVVRHEAAMSIPYGMSHAQALKSITLDAAKILKIDDQYGSLEPGKIADLVIYDGDPFEHSTHVVQVLMEGKQVFERNNEVTDWKELIGILPNLPETGCCLGF
ncbi:MAG: amidohydrolase family protein [Planctomycetaceae bacterium]